MQGVNRYYTRDGRNFTITAYPIGSRYLCMISTETGVCEIVEGHVAPGTEGAVGATEVQYFGTSNEAIAAGRREIDAQFLWPE